MRKKISCVYGVLLLGVSSVLFAAESAVDAVASNKQASAQTLLKAYSKCKSEGSKTQSESCWNKAFHEQANKMSLKGALKSCDLQCATKCADLYVPHDPDGWYRCITQQ